MIRLNQKLMLHPRYGNSLVKFDKDAERKLRLKIDLYIIPTVALLYLFCFIDRANIGMLVTFVANLTHVTDLQCR